MILFPFGFEKNDKALETIKKRRDRGIKDINDCFLEAKETSASKIQDFLTHLLVGSQYSLLVEICGFHFLSRFEGNLGGPWYDFKDKGAYFIYRLSYFETPPLRSRRDCFPAIISGIVGPMPEVCHLDLHFPKSKLSQEQIAYIETYIKTGHFMLSPKYLGGFSSINECFLTNDSTSDSMLQAFFDALDQSDFEKMEKLSGLSFQPSESKFTYENRKIDWGKVTVELQENCYCITIPIIYDVILPPGFTGYREASFKQSFFLPKSKLTQKQIDTLDSFTEIHVFSAKINAFILAPTTTNTEVENLFEALYYEKLFSMQAISKVSCPASFSLGTYSYKAGISWKRAKVSDMGDFYSVKLSIGHAGYPKTTYRDLMDDEGNFFADFHFPKSKLSNEQQRRLNIYKKHPLFNNPAEDKNKA